MSAAVWQPLQLRSGERIKDYPDDHTIRIDRAGEGSDALAVSADPVVARDEDGTSVRWICRCSAARTASCRRTRLSLSNKYLAKGKEGKWPCLAIPKDTVFVPVGKPGKVMTSTPRDPSGVEEIAQGIIDWWLDVERLDWDRSTSIIRIPIEAPASKVRFRARD